MITTKESTRELLGLDKVNQVEYVASSVQLKAKPKAEELFNAGFLPPLAERLPLK